MANLTINLLNVTLAPAEEAAAQAAIAGFETSIANVERTLTDEERSSYLSLDVSNKVFAHEALQEATTNGAILPSAVNIAFLGNDLTLFNQMDALESQLEDALRRVKDTKRVAGHEAYAMALTIYTLFRSLAAVGIAGAQQSADRLGERFANNGGGSVPSSNGTPPATPGPGTVPA